MKKQHFYFFFPNFKANNLLLGHTVTGLFLGDEGVFNLIPKFLGNERYE